MADSKARSPPGNMTGGIRSCYGRERRCRSPSIDTAAYRLASLPPLSSNTELPSRRSAPSLPAVTAPDTSCHVSWGAFKLYCRPYRSPCAWPHIPSRSNSVPYPYLIASAYVPSPPVSIKLLPVCRSLLSPPPPRCASSGWLSGRCDRSANDCQLPSYRLRRPLHA